MPSISIIVPVYKVEQYIERCVQSVLSQRGFDVQLILVDDGSPDRCGAICDELAAASKNTIVLHKENGGLSDARNAGIRAATGEYLLFLDSDDRLVEGCLERIDAILESKRPDVLVGQYKAVNESSGATLFDKDCELRRGEIESGEDDRVFGELRRARISPCAWRYVVRREFLTDNGLFFEKGLLCEDAHWTPRLLCAARSLALNQEPFYEYNIRAASIMTTANFKRVSDLLRIARENYDFAKELPQSKRDYVFGGVCIMLNSALQEWSRFSRLEKAEVRAWFRDNREAVLKTGKARKEVRAAHLLLGGFLGTLAESAITARHNRNIGVS